MYTHVEPPCERNVEIYHDIVGGMSQREAARKYDLSQPMISKIVKQYKQWMCAAAPDEEFDSEQRDYIATDAWCETLERGKELAYAAYQQSCMPSQAARNDGEPTRWYPPKPDMRCVKTMVDCAEKFVVASKAREQARYALRFARSRDPAYIAEQERIRREETQDRIAEEKRKRVEVLCREVAAAEHREISHDEAMAIVTQGRYHEVLNAAREKLAAAQHQPNNGAVPAPTKPAPTVIKPSDNRQIPAEKGPSDRLSPSPMQNVSSGVRQASNGARDAAAGARPSLQREPERERRSA